MINSRGLSPFFGEIIKLEIEQHSYCRKLISNLIERKGKENYKDFASEFAITAGVPIFTTYFYIGEIVGFDSWIVTRMKAISKFYGYTEIIADTDIDLKQFIGD